MAMQRKLVLIGGWLALFGLLGGGASIVVPWMGATTILNLPHGLWYVLFLCSLWALLGTAAMGVGRGRKFAGVAGPILSVLTAFVVVGLITTSEGRAAAGGWLGLASLPPLGFACGLIAIGRARAQAPSGTSGLYDAGHA
ncbi:hypothetical protein [Dactylosporangium sp. CS-033363]|uniref:hypothetical protein n=1 Tax=Dactylosporangium sp. CS-033363 TaxID=3239935 RepID=UPI003D92B186